MEKNALFGSGIEMIFENLLVKSSRGRLGSARPFVELEILHLAINLEAKCCKLPCSHSEGRETKRAATIATRLGLEARDWHLD